MTTPQSPYDDHRRPLQRALKLGTGALIVVSIISLAAWGAFRGLPGIWGVLLGAAIGGGFMLLTVISVLATARTSTTTTGAVVLGGWLLKIIVFLIIMVVLKDLYFYDHMALFVTVVIAMICVLASEMYGVITTNVTYVSESQRPE
ncbi:hypothetical protein [Corynebacterium pseudopelargi]|uniref:ATP synthase I chain n=1 Tax=Corynebacterium pseudopelargi TaxID=2080757 RepID=A0A3G6J010_9CORY|nr:hypothetical protein [Corynebacterium pseudopelargi]AZA09474.1 hypothetical protein CPPEL_06815 [Corynebacterium pseudopelargi]